MIYNYELNLCARSKNKPFETLKQFPFQLERWYRVKTLRSSSLWRVLCLSIFICVNFFSFAIKISNLLEKQLFVIHSNIFLCLLSMRRFLVCVFISIFTFFHSFINDDYNHHLCNYFNAFFMKEEVIPKKL